MFDQLPKMFGGRAAVRNDDNVTPLRDTEPTRPHRHRPFEHNPPPPPAQEFPSGTYGPNLPKSVRHEMAVAREIFVELLNIDSDARTRVVQQVEHLLKMYGDEKVPNVEGAPV